MRALGKLTDADKRAQPHWARLFSPVLRGEAADDEPALFVPLRPTQADEWLAGHAEPGQSFQSFQRTVFKAVPHATYRSLVLFLLGDFETFLPMAPLVQCLEAFFFGMKVELAPIEPGAARSSSIASLVESGVLRSRESVDGGGQQQLYTAELLSWMNDRMAACARADRGLARRVLVKFVVTTADITPDDEHNFVFGIASPTDGIGVFSLARMHPEFGTTDGADPTPAMELSRADRKLLFIRSFRVLAHESAHMLGLRHCRDFRCIMNGSNHIAELDSKPLHLCPVCLRKVLSSLAVDGLARYKALHGALGLAADAYDIDLADELVWLERCIDFVQRGNIVAS